MATVLASKCAIRRWMIGGENKPYTLPDLRDPEPDRKIRSQTITLLVIFGGPKSTIWEP